MPGHPNPPAGYAHTRPSERLERLYLAPGPCLPRRSALPVRICIRDAFDSTCTELTVTASIDSGGRGRPRVTFDVTQGLSVAGVGVFMADGGHAKPVGAVLLGPLHFLPLALLGVEAACCYCLPHSRRTCTPPAPPCSLH